METSNTPPSEAESLRIITHMISQAKSGIRENGFLYLLWGYLVFGASLCHFILMEVGYQHPYIAWSVMFVGAIISFVYGIRQGKKQKVKTHFGRTMGFLWGAFSISLFIVLGAMAKLGPENTYPMILILYGIGTFVSGGVLQFKPLIAGGIACWLMAIACYFLSFKYQLPVLSLAVLIAYIIPGHILKARPL